MDMAPTALNYSRICHVYNVYSGINRGVNKKEGAILRYFNVYNILMFVTWILPQITARGFVFNQLEAGLAKFEIQDPKVIDHSYLGSISFSGWPLNQASGTKDRDSPYH